MKKILLSLTALVLILSSVFALSACDNDKKTENQSGDAVSSSAETADAAEGVWLVTSVTVSTGGATISYDIRNGVSDVLKEDSFVLTINADKTYEMKTDFMGMKETEIGAWEKTEDGYNLVAENDEKAHFTVLNDVLTVDVVVTQNNVTMSEIIVFARQTDPE